MTSDVPQTNSFEMNTLLHTHTHTYIHIYIYIKQHWFNFRVDPSPKSIEFLLFFIGLQPANYEEREEISGRCRGKYRES